VAGPEYFELRVEQQKRVDDVLLGPKAVLLHHPRLRILVRQEYVVKVDQDSWLQSVKDPQYDVANV
jgi:hypothetical protein